jgi:signal transduction histidine kinase
MDFATFVHPDYIENVTERVRKRMGNYNTPSHYEIKVISKSGETKWLDVSSNLIQYEGATAGIVIFMDITKKKNAEGVLKRDNETLERLVNRRTKELLKAHIELDRARRMSDIGRLSATVAHEIRNPLAAIKTAAYNIQRKANNPLLDKHLATINKKVIESDHIIKNLLSFTRIKTVEIEKLNVCETLRLYCYGFGKVRRLEGEID